MRRLQRSLRSIVLATSLAVSAPHARADSNALHRQPETRAIVYSVNTLGNGLLCGLAAVVKKRRTVIKDFFKCALAGSVQYAGMELGMRDVPALPGFSLRLVETGTSMINNTLAGRSLLERLDYEVNALLVSYDTRQHKVDVYWRVLPLIGVARNLAEGNNFSLEESLSYQTAVFYRRPQEGTAAGGYIGNVLVYERNVFGEMSPSSPSYRAHEFAHVLQYNRVRPFQLALPRSLGFLEQKLHLRTGEDIGAMLLATPVYLCRLAGAEDCDLQPYNLQEMEAYTMQTAN